MMLMLKLALKRPELEMVKKLGEQCPLKILRRLEASESGTFHLGRAHHCHQVLPHKSLSVLNITQPHVLHHHQLLSSTVSSSFAL